MGMTAFLIFGSAAYFFVHYGIWVLLGIAAITIVVSAILLGVSTLSIKYIEKHEAQEESEGR